MAYLHRLVNGGGFIGREVGVGRKRIDLLVRWPYKNRRGKRAVQREALELKVWRDGDKDPLAPGVKDSKAKLEEHKYPVVFREIPNLGHQYLTDELAIDASDEMVRWIDSLDRI